MAYELAREHAIAGAALLPDDAWELDYEFPRHGAHHAPGRVRVPHRQLHGGQAPLRRHPRPGPHHAGEGAQPHPDGRAPPAQRPATTTPAPSSSPAWPAPASIVPAPADTDEAPPRFVGAEQAELAERMRGREIPGLLDMPTMTDPLRLATMSLLEELSQVGMFFTPLLVNLRRKR